MLFVARRGVNISYTLYYIILLCSVPYTYFTARVIFNYSVYFMYYYIITLYYTYNNTHTYSDVCARLLVDGQQPRHDGDERLRRGVCI